MSEKDLSKYDRVTSVLAPFSGIDKVPRHILDAAADRGTRVHALCQGLIDGIEVDVPEEYKGYVDSFRQWQEGKIFISNPGRMYCDKLMVTGECDGIYLDKFPVIFDLKTSQKESCTWKLQGAAYSHLFNKGVTDAQVFVILDKKGGSPKEFHYSYRENIQTFFKCLDLYRLFFKTKKPIDEAYL